MNRSLIAVLIWIAGCSVFALDEHVKYKHLAGFEVPAEFDNVHQFAPLGYLATYPIDPAYHLSEKERNAVRDLVASAYRSSIKKYRQDYALLRTTAFYKMLLANYPDLKTVKAEGNGVYLFDILEVLQASPKE
ncbi:hypothetical protein [Prosthecobacter sp.]|uniref:hypothetical protein n=1 Tax=Prosthecobacter sp. TaxID=1965333 RepID=UPI003783D5C1